MGKRKKPEEIGTLSNELGTRVLRSEKELSPYQLGPGLVIQNIDALRLFPNGYSDQQAPWPLKKETSVMHTKLPPGPPPAIISSPDALRLSEFQLVQSGRLATPAIKRIASYIDKGLLSLFPELHCLYANIDRQIVDVDKPKIPRCFESCWYPACRFNLHNCSTTFHSVYWSYIGGMCAALNGVSFDFKCSAHFIARSLRLVIELPPNSYPPLLFLTPTHLWPKMNGAIISYCRTH
ncbi:hypothetical protein BT96DRAFT_994144 [Gymnopus androsaceus JB14]|uniref:Uncharacterized protein n=1 Tax=Gymnopus androsaceus JB14 TaxID=1447944 RepID=A0A6A4HQ74_9AGAR|nr:hypothetical protein BT96DRAFT_1010076 [Gymnopus androsaceus JB14]KAE9399174.1 hypothetical protein BT96DRAFT_994144 [Gymnopus androsaceus JB14]